MSSVMMFFRSCKFAKIFSIEKKTCKRKILMILCIVLKPSIIYINIIYNLFKLLEKCGSRVKQKKICHYYDSTYDLLSWLDIVCIYWNLKFWPYLLGHVYMAVFKLLFNYTYNIDTSPNSGNRYFVVCSVFTLYL